MLDELQQAAIEKHQRGEVPGEVVAIFVRATRAPDDDGLRWRFLCTDGREFVRVEARLLESEGGALEGGNGPALLEAAVERHAVGHFPIESRMADLASAGSIVLHAEDLRPHPKLPAAFL
jgi:hypothetical protein